MTRRSWTLVSIRVLVALPALHGDDDNDVEIVISVAVE